MTVKSLALGGAAAIMAALLAAPSFADQASSQQPAMQTQSSVPQQHKTASSVRHRHHIMRYARNENQNAVTRRLNEQQFEKARMELSQNAPATNGANGAGAYGTDQNAPNEANPNSMNCAPGDQSANCRDNGSGTYGTDQNAPGANGSNPSATSPNANAPSSTAPNTYGNEQNAPNDANPNGDTSPNGMNCLPGNQTANCQPNSNQPATTPPPQ